MLKMEHQFTTASVDPTIGSGHWRYKGKKGTLIFTILWMFSILTSNVSGTVKDRFVVRENHARLLKCEHNQENINGVKWLFVSNQTNESETVFDSQKKNNLNEGITSNCQNKFCNLKILSAKKEQSGTYFCYTIKDNNDNNMTLVTEIEIVVRGSKKETLIVSIGDSVVLLCEHNIRNVTRTRWSHVSIEGYHTYDFYYMGYKTDLDSNYEAHCEFHQLSCNLKIHKIDKQSAGKYICMHGDSLDYEEKFGLDEMTYFVEIEIVAGDLSCNENVPEDLTLLGENDCYGTMPSVLNLKCSFNYYGNIDENLVHMEWVEENEFNSSSLTSFTTFENAHNAKKISTQSNVSVSYNMMISTFKCALPETKVKHCERHRFQVQYASNTTVRSPSIHSNEFHSVNCLANISEKVQCSYYWVHEIGGAMLQNPYRILPAEHMNSPGVYTCLAKCNVEGNDHCFLKAMEFELIPGLSKTGIIIIVILSLLFVAFLTFVVWFCVRKRTKTRRLLFKSEEVQIQRKKIACGELPELTNICVEDLSNESTPFNGLSKIVSNSDEPPAESIETEKEPIFPMPKYIQISENAFVEKRIVQKFENNSKEKSIIKISQDKASGIVEIHSKSIKEKSGYFLKYRHGNF